MKSSQNITLPELLAPAGSFDKLVTAVHYGADAVYLGGKEFSLRARAANFKPEKMKEAVAYAHRHGVKLYVTVNIFAHNSDLKQLPVYLKALETMGVDGIIVADPGVLAIARETTPALPIHLSTQANVTNAASAAFWADQGVSRINLARELGRREIREISDKVDIELEIFVHGALCISYSGRCMLSNYMTGRDANKGDCAHPCRYSYKLVEEKRPGQYYPVEEDERGTYIFNSRDLCLASRIPQLISSGADSIKIEGRMKSVAYVGSAVRLYRAVLDFIEKKCGEGVALHDIQLPEIFKEEIRKIGTRGQTENFFDAHPSSEDMLYDTMRVTQGFVPAGIVREVDPLTIETRNVLNKGDVIEYLGRSIEPLTATVEEMVLEDGSSVERVNPNSRVKLHTAPPLKDTRPNSIVRKFIPSS